MPRNCVCPLSELLDKLTEKDELKRTSIDRALQGWNDPATGASPIAFLRFWHNLPQQGYDAHKATNTILDEAIIVLRGAEGEKRGKALRDLEQAELLHIHYWEGKTIEQLAARHKIDEKALTGRLKRARKRLAEVVYQLDIKARVEHRLSQLQRLETPTYHTLIGASSTQQRLKDLIRKPGPPYLIAIQAKGGDGKTAHLDKAIRDLINDDVWDQVVWISAAPERLTIGGRLHDLGRPILTRAALLERLFEELFPNRSKPASFSDGAAVNMLEQRSKECPICIILDNAEAVPNIDDLLSVLERFVNPSKVILTTRESIGGYTISPAPFILPELSEQDASLLIQEIARTYDLARVQALNDQDRHRIYALVGGSPLALKLIAHLIGARGLDHVLDSFKSAGSPAGENLFTFIFLHSWQQLDQAERSVLLSMLLLSPQGGEYALLARITKLGKRELRKALDKLISLSLVQARGNGNEMLYWIHNLTRSFLQEEVLRTVADLSPEDESNLAEFDRYIHRAIEFVNEEIEHGGPLLQKNEREQALHILTYALDWALLKPSVWPAARALLLGLGPKLELAGFRAGWIPYVKQGVDISKAIADQQGEALLQAHLALLLRATGEYEAAHDALKASVLHFTTLGDTGNLADALTQRAHIYCIQRRHQQARPFIQQALDLLTEIDPRREYIYYLEGLIALNENDPVAAEEKFKKSLEIGEQQGDKRLIAKQLGVLGTALYTQRQLDQAQEYYERSIALAAEVQDDVQVAMMTMGLDNIWILRQQPIKALAEYANAEPTLRNAHEVFNQALLDTNWGLAKRQLGELQEAEERLFSAIDRWQYLGDFYREANARYEVGLLYRAQQLIEKARQSFNEALACLDKCEPGSGLDALRQSIAAGLKSLDAAGDDTAPA